MAHRENLLGVAAVSVVWQGSGMSHPSAAYPKMIKAICGLPVPTLAATNAALANRLVVRLVTDQNARTDTIKIKIS
jgi:hypothetical protein